MSKKKKQLRGFDDDEKWVVGFGAFLLALGLLSIIIGIVRTNEIANSEIIKDVEAEVTYSEIQSKELSSSQKREKKRAEERGEIYYVAPDYYYKAKVKFEAEGKTYKGNYYSENSLTKGQKVKVNVFKNAKGKYKVIDPIKHDVGSYIIYGAIGGLVGLGLILLCVINKAMDNSEVRKNQKKKKKQN